MVAHARPDVIFHTAVSKFKDAFAQIEPMARRGISVVSSCEELLFPQLRNPDWPRSSIGSARSAGARVVGTGVNPGFVMDVLPVCLTGVSREVRAVHVQRVVNASTRRAPLQKKIGSGLPPAEFRRLFKEGKAGHAGLQGVPGAHRALPGLAGQEHRRDRRRGRGGPQHPHAVSCR